MKALEWQRRLDEQRVRHGKTVFTPTELAHLSSASLQVLNVVLHRLMEQGVIERYAHGLYGLPGAATADDIVPFIDHHAYITGAYALYRHGHVSQIPGMMDCFTSRRHNRSRVRVVPGATVEFVCVRRPIYHPPTTGLFALPEQALCDMVYIARRRGIDPENMVTFRNLSVLKGKTLARMLRSYPRATARVVNALVGVE